MKVAFVTSHPIQYQVPVFRHLAEMPGIELIVLYAMLPDADTQGAGFGVAFEWDLPLLEGYEYRVLENVARKPSVTRFGGCDTPGIGRALRELGAEVVVVNGWVVKACLQALWAAKRLGIPCMVRGEANDLRARPAWKRWLQGMLVRQYDRHLYIGKANRSFYESRGIVDEQLYFSPYCVENERFSHETEERRIHREEIRARWAVEQHAACFLFCGKFEDKKHPAELLHAFADAAKEQPHLHLLMVGDGVLRGKCEALAQTANLPVSFTGFLNQSEIIDAYVAADCLVLPSDAGETWGLVVNEAMACGLPAIVSDRVGCSEDLVENGKTGMVFPFGDWVRLSESIATLSRERQSLRAMGASANARVREYAPLHAARGIAAAVASL